MSGALMFPAEPRSWLGAYVAYREISCSVCAANVTSSTGTIAPVS
jgi:hypothetical protein